MIWGYHYFRKHPYSLFWQHVITGKSISKGHETDHISRYRIDHIAQASPSLRSPWNQAYRCIANFFWPKNPWFFQREATLMVWGPSFGDIYRHTDVEPHLCGKKLMKQESCLVASVIKTLQVLYPLVWSNKHHPKGEHHKWVKSHHGHADYFSQVVLYQSLAK